MGFSVSGATAIVFVGLLVSAATVLPAVDRYTERRGDALTARDERALTRQNTDLALANASYADAANRTGGTLTVDVENTGASTLAVGATTLLVDGRHSTPDTSVEGDAVTDVWAPGETLTLTVNWTAATPPERVKLAAENGVAAAGEVT